MSSHQDVLDRWLQVQANGRDARLLKGARVLTSGDVAYSYGRHFELVRILRDKDGEVSGFLLNGDNYSVSTSRHQSEARASVSRVAGPARPSVIIPYSALGAAGIAPEDVEIVHVTPDGRDVRIEEHFTQPPGAIWEWQQIRGYRERFPDEIEEVLRIDYDSRLLSWEEGQDAARRARNGELDETPYWRKQTLARWLERRPTRRTYEQWIEAGSTTYGRRQREIAWEIVGYRRVCWVNGRRNQEWEIEFLPDGTTSYRREHVRHWLGESLIRARIEYATRPKCPACKGRPVQGPMHRDWFERSDRDWLKNTEGRYVEPYDYSWLQAVDIPPAHCDRCDGRGWYTKWRHRTAYFLSGFDHQEKRRSYFFCELPKGAAPTTVDEAYEALKPEPVVLAETMGREVLRQGDIFAIPTARIKRELMDAGGEHGRMSPLLGTNHCATDVVTVGALTYARGILHHVPGGRPPDHARVKIGQGWHLIVKNTVPLSA